LNVSDRGSDCTARAVDLAESGRFAELRDLITHLRQEGFPTVLTDLRSQDLRRDLRRRMAAARRDVPAAT